MTEALESTDIIFAPAKTGMSEFMISAAFRAGERAKLVWRRADLTGYAYRTEGNAVDYGNYVVERDDCESPYQVHWGHVHLGETDSAAAAKALAQSHCKSLAGN